MVRNFCAAIDNVIAFKFDNRLINFNIKANNTK